MYRKAKSSWLKHLDFILLDIVSIELTFFLAYMIRHGIEVPLLGSPYVQMCVVLVLIDFCVVFFGESYNGVLQRGYWREFRAVLQHVTMVVLFAFAYMFLLQTSSMFSRSVFLMTWLGGIAVCFGARIGLKAFVRKKLMDKTRLRVVVSITTKELAAETLESVRKYVYRDYRIIGFVIMDEHMTGKYIEDVPVVADKEEALEYLRTEVVDEVFFNLPKEIELPQDIMDGCIAMGITTHLNLMKISQMEGNKVIEKFGDYTVMTTSIHMASDRQVLFKRGLDILGGIVGVILTLIAAIFVAPVIYIQSPGPIFFTQTRIGRNGRPFKIYKFRSMYMDAEERKKELMDQNEMEGLMFKMKDDPRIFPFGHFLRKSSIDELPQFINVLKGEMSLVGTRPPTVDEYEKYEMGHKKRLSIKPGLTGMWQVSGRSNITDFEEVVKLDTKYILEWNLGLDIKILLKTVLVVLGKEGSK